MQSQSDRPCAQSIFFSPQRSYKGTAKQVFHEGREVMPDGSCRATLSEEIALQIAGVTFIGEHTMTVAFLPQAMCL